MAGLDRSTHIVKRHYFASQGVKSWELRAATSLARLRQSQGERQAAYSPRQAYRYLRQAIPPKFPLQFKITVTLRSEGQPIAYAVIETDLQPWHET